MQTQFHSEVSGATETRIYKVIDFKSGAKTAKEQGGKFNPTNKTWAIKINPEHWNKWHEEPEVWGLKEVK
jgi:hypothetical protein